MQSIDNQVHNFKASANKSSVAFGAPSPKIYNDLGNPSSPTNHTNTFLSILNKCPSNITNTPVLNDLAVAGIYSAYKADIMKVFNSCFKYFISLIFYIIDILFRQIRVPNDDTKASNENIQERAGYWKKRGVSNKSTVAIDLVIDTMINDIARSERLIITAMADNNKKKAFLGIDL